MLGSALPLGLLGLLLAWAVMAGPGNGRGVALVISERDDTSRISQQLAERGVLSSPRLFSLYATLFRLKIEPGPHLLSDSDSPRDLAQRLARVPRRARQRLPIPEGYNQFQIAERLQEASICSAEAFQRASHDRTLLRELGIPGQSAEGFLFPATYNLRVDTDPRDVIRIFVRQLRKRLDFLQAKHPGAIERLRREHGFGEAEILNLASVIEKEARVPEERPLIASVYFNRLSDPEFKPKRMLQADPTAAYGCLVMPEKAQSCSDYRGRVTPAMLQDEHNPYNTYKHPGLPPGPIANPGDASIEAVLAPAETDYLFFVHKGDGRHSFSRSLAEHNQAIRKAP